MIRIPQLLTLIALIAGVPLFLRMPVWADVTLYDVAVRSLHLGGIHYRDVFDTNLPGFVWVLAILRRIIGPSFTALRAVDLAIFTGVVLLADRLAKRSGAGATSRWWSFAAIAFWYPCTLETIHGQRDVWMAVPALAAVLLRIRRFQTNQSAFRGGFCEGVLWGCAVWIKPHLLPVAFFVWLATARSLGRSQLRPIVHDLLGNILGGGIVGTLGIVWLVSTGTWRWFIDVLTTWNSGYFDLMMGELEMRGHQGLFWFPPWSIFMPFTVTLAILRIASAIYRGVADPIRFTRLTVAVLYLSWISQSFFLQRGFQYVHVVETVLLFAVWATYRPWIPILGLSWILITSLMWLIADGNPDWKATLESACTPEMELEPLVIRHQFSDPWRMKHWATCWRLDLTPTQRAELRDSLRTVWMYDKFTVVGPHEAAPGWVELEEVAEYLRSQGVKDGELVAWHDSPHVVYLILDVQPGFRFMHVNTVQLIGEEAVTRMQAELETAAPHLRFAVSDLERAGHLQPREIHANCLSEPTSAENLLPPLLPADHARSFPFCQPTVFRSGNGKGRYIVHLIDHSQPIGDCRIPQ